jgi:hypothetical protein
MIPFNSYHIDSAKFYLDFGVLEKINIPNEFILIDSETGNVLDNFKKNSLTIPYKNHKIYLGKEVKILPNKKPYEKVVFYFPAKINPEKYFFGITEEMVKEVLLHIRDLGYINFKDLNRIYQNIEVKDLDIKIDHKFSWLDKEKILDYNKSLQNRFNGYPNEFKPYNNKVNGIGIQTYKREYSTLAKPFLKFYSKSDEIQNVTENLFDLMPNEIQEIVKNNFIYRYEFTIKTLDFFKHFNISNKFSDIIKIDQDKWREIGKYYLNKNFQREIKKPLDVSRLKPIEQIICLMIYDSIQLGRTIEQIRLIFNSFDNRTQRLRNNKLFDRCYYFASVPNQETDRLIRIYEQVKEMDKLFGF